MSGGPSFPDLIIRSQSAFVLVAVGLGTFWIGGDAVVILLTITAALMAWEIAAMHGPDKTARLVVAVIAGLGFVAAFLVSDLVRYIYIVALVGTLYSSKFRSPVLCIVAIIAIVEITLVLEQFNWQYGLVWTLWLISVVAATDIGGYFAGRYIGGPKIFPRISPKKTWAGTIGGWVFALVVSLVFLACGMGTIGLLVLTVLVAIASQAGDLAESYIKRRAGVKDASAIIPGHGGLLDRFDGLLGACLMIGFADTFGLLPLLGLPG